MKKRSGVNMSLSPRSPRSFPKVTPSDVLKFTKPTKGMLDTEYGTKILPWGARWCASEIETVFTAVLVVGASRRSRNKLHVDPQRFVDLVVVASKRRSQFLDAAPHEMQPLHPQSLSHLAIGSNGAGVEKKQQGSRKRHQFEETNFSEL